MTTTAGRPKRAIKRKQMVRKQSYILPRQDEALKRLAEQRAVSEAELIRDASDELLQEPAEDKQLQRREAAWQEILAFIEQRQETGVPGEPPKWKRKDGYEGGRAVDHGWCGPSST